LNEQYNLQKTKINYFKENKEAKIFIPLPSKNHSIFSQNNNIFYYKSDFINPVSSFNTLIKSLIENTSRKTPIIFIPVESISLDIKFNEITQILDICSEAPIIGLFSKSSSSMKFYDYIFNIGNETFSIAKEITKYNPQSNEKAYLWNYIFTSNLDTLIDIISEYNDQNTNKDFTFTPITNIIKNCINKIYFPYESLQCSIVDSYKYFFNSNKGIAINNNSNFYSNKEMFLLSEENTTNTVIVHNNIIVNSKDEMCSNSLIKSLLKDKFSNFLY